MARLQLLSAQARGSRGPAKATEIMMRPTAANFIVGSDWEEESELGGNLVAAEKTLLNTTSKRVDGSGRRTAKGQKRSVATAGA
jgi:hypothetical protein